MPLHAVKGEREEIKMKFPYKAIVAIAAITILEALAIIKGIDGAALGIAVAAIAGIGGYTIGAKTKPK